MSMSEMQTPAPTPQPMDTGASRSSFSQPSFSQSQALSLQQSTKPPAKIVPAAQPEPTENSTDVGISKKMAVSEIAKVSA